MVFIEAITRNVKTQVSSQRTPKLSNVMCKAGMFIKNHDVPDPAPKRVRRKRYIDKLGLNGCIIDINKHKI